MNSHDLEHFVSLWDFSIQICVLSASGKADGGELHLEVNCMLEDSCRLLAFLRSIQACFFLFFFYIFFKWSVES